LAAPSTDAALVVEGGALRGIFSTGVLDGFLEAKFNPFNMYIGVSSGASNIAAYLAEMIGRNASIYMDYSRRPEFISIAKFIRGGHLMDLDWLWNITIHEVRLDLATIYIRNKPFIIAMTDVQNGHAVYKSTDAANLEHVMKASSAIPFFYRGYPEVDGRPMTDGGIADPIPVQEAIRRGARRIMVIRSRHRDYLKRRGFSDAIMRWYVWRYPLLRQRVAGRMQRYNEAVALIRKPPAGVSVCEICPPDTFRVSRFSQDRSILAEGYHQGRAMAGEAMASW
jgi:predicted patatin/cPLA2 family phospholipase